MLKKRILASSLASVMALSSVSVVAFADETAASDIKTEVVSKAQLKEYVEGFDSFLKSDIYEYGTTQADQFQNAVDYAENVINDSKATDVDVTAAYQMLKGVYESLEKHTAQELKDLLADYKDIYDSNNILNEDLNDNIYDPEKYTTFYDEYEEADTYVDSEDGRLITDAYVALEKARKDLSELDYVTKKEFRDALKDFEQIASKLKDYESWRRGTVSVNPETGTNFKAASGAKKVKLSGAYYVEFGALVNIVYGASDVGLVKNNKGEALNDTSLGQTWIAVGSEGTVEEFVNAKYEEFDKIQSSSRTTNTDIVLACNAAKEAVKVFNSWQADNTDRAAKANINALIDKYRAKLVRDCASYDDGITEQIFNFVNDAAKLPAYDGGTEWKTADKIELILDKKTKLIAVDDDGNLVTEANSAIHVTQSVSKNQDIMKYIPVTSDDVAAVLGLSGDTYDNIAGLKDACDAAYDEMSTAKTAYDEAVATLNAALEMDIPALTTIAEDTENFISLTQIKSYDNSTELVAATTLKKYKVTDTSSASKADVVAWNALVDAVKTAHNKLSETASSVQGTYGSYTNPTNTEKTSNWKGDSDTSEDKNVSESGSVVVPAVVFGETEVCASVTIKTYTYSGTDTTTQGAVDGWNKAASDAKTAAEDLNTALKGLNDDLTAYNTAADALKDEKGNSLAPTVDTYAQNGTAVNLAQLEAFGSTTENPAYIIETETILTPFTNSGGDVAGVYKDYNDAVTAANTAYNSLTGGLVSAYTTKAAAYDTAWAAWNAATRGIVGPVVDEDMMGIFEELGDMLAIVEAYNAADEVSDKDARAAAFASAYALGVDGLDENNIVEKPEGSRNEYTLINRKLTYILEDIYPEIKTDKYTKKDVQDLIDKAYDLCDKTGDSEVFHQNHLAVVDRRKEAIAWVTSANKDKSYKDGEVPEDESMTATEMYEYLKGKYDDLEKDWKAMPISYGEIAELIANTASGLDNGSYGASADKIKEALAKVAVGLSTLEATLDENQPFNYDREFVSYNRLHCDETSSALNKKKPNDAEKTLKKNIDALNAAIAEAGTEPAPEVTLGDLDGDGVATPADAVMIVKAFVGQVTLTDAQKAAADYNKDGVVNADDALAVVKAYVGL